MSGELMLRAALHFAKRGWPVFPLREGARTPAFTGSFHDATTDPAAIRQWFRQRPEMNLGISTHTRGPFVVDLDVKNGKDGICEWRRLCHGREVPDTLTIETPSGGQHLFFVCTDELRPKSTVNAPAHGIDIRGRGGYVVGPPSTAREGRYRVLSTHDPAPAPAWLLDLLRANGARRSGRGQVESAITERCVEDPERYRISVFRRLLTDLRSAREGARNDTLNRVAFRMGQFAGPAIELDDLVDRLTREGESLGLPWTEAVATARSGATAGMASPIELKPVP